MNDDTESKNPNFGNVLRDGPDLSDNFIYLLNGR